MGEDALFQVTGSHTEPVIRLNHPLLNNNPNAIFFVQARGNSTLGVAIQAYPDYNAQEGRWWLRNYNPNGTFLGQRYDILVIQKHAP